MLPNQQTFTSNVDVHITMACRNGFQLLNKVLTFFSGLFVNALLQCDVDGCNGSSTGKRITAGCGCMNEKIAVDHAPDFGRGHESTDGHHTTTYGFGRGDNIGSDIPMLDTP